nr:hypothetical protein Itr_chr08CG11950 [Ipomoea trifida]GMD14463.1 hypothetical protein Iba_chr07bCG6650 [Ipomoea batatas]GMD83403.1 hypothetical protein Iba_scaffold52685CG0010 [Ipomoea batatas]
MSPTLPLLHAERPLLPQPRTTAVFHRSVPLSRGGQGKEGVAAGVHHRPRLRSLRLRIHHRCFAGDATVLLRCCYRRLTFRGEKLPPCLHFKCFLRR